MHEDTFRIVYCSRATLDGPIAPEETTRILATSRRNNARSGVTGALLINGSFFVQVLEGSFDSVQTVFERIQHDPRHDDIVVLQAEVVATRVFAEWSMAQAQPDNPAHVHAILSTAMIERNTASSSLLNLLSHVVHHVPA